MFGQIEVKDKWHEDRWKKFTASKCGCLLLPGKNGEMFSAGGLTYIEEKAIECLTTYWENPKLEYVKGILHGKRYEEPAFNHYCEITRNFDMRYFGTEDPLFLSYNENSGGSPDGLMGQGIDIHVGLELKCPEQSSVHWEYFKFKDQFSLKDNCRDHYGQVQMLLLITKAPVWHWCSFDERFLDKRKQMKLIEVYPDRKVFDAIEIRIRQAVKIRDQMVEEFLNS